MYSMVGSINIILIISLVWIYMWGIWMNEWMNEWMNVYAMLHIEGLTILF